MSQALQIPSLLPVTQSFVVRSLAGELGDGQDQHALPIGRIVDDSWQITTPPLRKSQLDELVNQLKALSPTGFSWRLREPRIVTSADFNVYTWELPFDLYGEYECSSWDTTWIGGDYWQLSLKIERTGHQEIDECLIRPSDLATTYPLLPLNLYTQGNKQSFESKTLGQRFNGGTEERATYGYNATRDTWNFTATVTEIKKQEVVTFLSDRCGNFFEFRVDPSTAGKTYTCVEWSVKLLGQNWQGTVWEVSLTMRRSFLPFRKSDVLQIIENFDFYSNQDEIRQVMEATFADVDEKLDGAYDWLMRHTRNEYPFILNSQELLVNAFHTVLGRGGYFPPSAGVTEGQALITRACMLAYFATGKQHWVDKAVVLGDAMLNYFYPVKIPSGWTPADGMRNPHWLINIKEAFVAKGLPAPDPLNMGHFDLVVNFVNGEGFIPTGAPHYGELLANIFRVYPIGDRLLWKNVFARPLGGFSYAVDYWVCNQMMQGVIKRQFADTESNNGREPVPTSEPTGKIKLATPFTGQAKVAYMTYTGGIIPVGGLFEAYPGWRGLRVDEAMAALDVFPWAYQAYDWLYSTTLDVKWLDAFNCNLYTFDQARTVINPTAWYQKSDSPEPFAYPGSQAILANFAPEQAITATRVTSGNKKDWLRLDIPTSPLQYPSAELQNFAVAAKLNPETTVYIEAACSVATELELILSLSKDAFDFSQYYTTRLPVSGADVPTARTFSAREFLLWDTARTSWHPYIADSPVYTYQGLGGTTSIAREQQVIDGIPRAVWRVTLDRNNGFAGAGFVCIGAKPRIPLVIFYKHIGNDAVLYVTIAGKKYGKKIVATNWGKVTIQAQSFEDSDGKSSSGGFATNVEIEANNESTTYVWWIGAEPQELPTPVQTYKAALVSRVTTAHTLWCGNFEAIGSPSNYLPYTPGILPYTCNVISDGKGGQVISAWQGTIPMIGYQDLEIYVTTGDWVSVNNVLDFFLDSQKAYREQSNSKIFGYFSPGYIWNMWSSGEYTSNGEINVFSFNTIDPNNSWSPYSFRAIKSCSRGWRKMVDGEFPGTAPPNLPELIAKAKKVTMDFLNALGADYVKRRNVRAITDFRQNIDPQVLYDEPHASALIADTALHANLAGGSPTVTLRVLKAAYNHMQNEWVSTGTMAGSFTKSQPTFTGNDGLEYRWNFGFWCGEQIFTLADLKLYKHRLIFPKCIYFVRP